MEHRFRFDDRAVSTRRAGQQNLVEQRLSPTESLVDRVVSTVAGPQSVVHSPGLCLGRDDDIDRIVAAATNGNGGAAVLVLGNAGIGKTRITEKLGVDSRVVDHFRERRRLVELERAASAVAALAEIAQAIGLQRTAPLAAVQAGLAAKPTLLILDNLEMPLHADGYATERLLCYLVSVPCSDGLAP
jgi:hypothetical protein